MQTTLFQFDGLWQALVIYYILTDNFQDLNDVEFSVPPFCMAMRKSLLIFFRLNLTEKLPFTLHQLC